MFEDTSIDNLLVEVDGAKLKTRDALAAVVEWPPTVANVRRVAALFVRPSPALLKSTARWFAVLEVLELAALTATEQLQVLMRATSGAFREAGVYPPAKMALFEALAAVDDDTLAMLDALPFRLLTEAEHEWAQRGGRDSQLTWRGDDIPTAEWLEEVRDEGDKLRNPFGLSGLGLLPEVLCDVWVSGYEDAPTDGSARTGEGPRVVRGGAEMIYPWQGCGEWQLLANAVRSSADEWEFFHSIRPAIGVRNE